MTEEDRVKLEMELIIIEEVNLGLLVFEGMCVVIVKNRSVKWNKWVLASEILVSNLLKFEAIHR